jgi:septal ring factor EnvC (AmiA/AmiB activator)
MSVIVFLALNAIVIAAMTALLEKWRTRAARAQDEADSLGDTIKKFEETNIRLQEGVSNAISELASRDAKIQQMTTELGKMRQQVQLMSAR